MEIKAHAKFLRLSPRKARIVLNTVKGKKALDAVAYLGLTPQKSSREIIKLINSALANAQHNFGLSKNNLIIKSISADIGPTFKRYKPRAKGSADMIKRKMTHLTVILEDLSGKTGTRKKKVEKQIKQKIKEPIKVEKKETEPKRAEEPEIKEETVVKKEEITKKIADKDSKVKELKDVKIKERKTKKIKTAERAKEPTSKEKSAKRKDVEKKHKEKFAPKKESFIGGVKRFFRRKGF